MTYFGAPGPQDSPFPRVSFMVSSTMMMPSCTSFRRVVPPPIQCLPVAKYCSFVLTMTHPIRHQTKSDVLVLYTCPIKRAFRKDRASSGQQQRNPCACCAGPPYRTRKHRARKARHHGLSDVSDFENYCPCKVSLRAHVSLCKTSAFMSIITLKNYYNHHASSLLLPRDLLGNEVLQLFQRCAMSSASFFFFFFGSEISSV